MYRILVADNKKADRDMTQAMIHGLFSGQLEIVSASNGREAVRLYIEKKCSIALLEVELPGINGLDAAEQIRSFDKKGVIIFLTACEEFSCARRAFGVHALNYLLKPVAKKELFFTLNEAVYVVEMKKTMQPEETPGEWKMNCEPDAHIKINAVADSIYAYIKNHYQEEIALQDVAEHLNYSEAYFCRLFKQCFGKNFRVFLTEYRMELAKELMADISISIKEVGARVGYQDSNYFTRAFKRVVGVTPSEYRLRILQGIDHPIRK